jgi:hypothetical protein
MTKSKEEARADQTAGQGKGLWAEASFGLEFLLPFWSSKKVKEMR